MNTMCKVAVFCGSRPGKNPLFEKHAKQLGALLASSKITVVYGGGNKGLMGAIANAAIAEKGEVIGIIPETLAEREYQHNGISELHVVDSMHTRKKNPL